MIFPDISRAKALYDFTGNSEQELSFKVTSSINACEQV